MATGRPRVGLDITSTHINLAVCEGGRILSAVSHMLPESMRDEGRVEPSNALAEIIKSCVLESGVPVHDCALAIDPKDVYTRRIDLPPMTVDELELNLPYEFRDYITDDPAGYMFDYAVLDSVRDSEGNLTELDIFAAAAPKAVIERYASMMKHAGLRLKAAAPCMMAYTNLIPPGDDRDYCFIEIGTHETLAHMFPRGVYEVTRPIDVGIRAIVEKVAEWFSVDYSVAATYFLNDTEGATTIPPCLELYEVLGVEIARVVSFYGFNFPGSMLEVIYFCGTGAAIEPLMDVVSKDLPVQARGVADMLPAAGISDSVLDMCAIAAGMALQEDEAQR